MSGQGRIRVWRRQLQLLPWLLWLGIMLAGGYYRHYMAGWQSWLLLMALAILFFVLFAGLLELLEKPGHDQGCSHDHAPQPRPSRWETLVHLAPLTIFLVMGPTSVAGLTGNLASRPRAEAPAPLPAEVPDGLPSSTPTDEARAHSSQGAEDQGGFQRLNLLELYNDLDKSGISARQVEVEGRVQVLDRKTQEAVRQRFGVSGVEIMLYRFLIVCCAADAQPVFVILKGVDPQNLGADQQWMWMRGTTAKLDGNPEFLTLTVESMGKIKEPSQPYLLPSWTK